MEKGRFKRDKMKKVFVYGILQKDISADSFGIKEEHYIGRATLYGYTRIGLSIIKKSKKNNDHVTGDIFEIPDELEEKLFRFENSFGYVRDTVTPQIKDDKTKHECIIYILKGGISDRAQWIRRHKRNIR